MSNSDYEKVGYCRPPRKHQFSSDNQPRRRRRKVAPAHGHHILASLLSALNEDVLISSKGKRRKVSAGEVLVRRLVNNALSGTFNDQIKLANLIQAQGWFEWEKMRNEIDEDHSLALKEEQTRKTDVIVDIMTN